HRRCTADEVRGEAAGDHDDVKIIGPDLLGTLVRLRRVAELAGVGLARFGADESDLAAGFLQAVKGVPDLHLLVLLLDKDRGALALEFAHDVRADDLNQSSVSFIPCSKLTLGE